MAASEMSELWVKGRPAAMNVHDRALSTAKESLASWPTLTSARKTGGRV